MANSRQLLSIIIPAYNEERTIRQAVSQVLAQRYGIPFEVIVVDDGSTDSTLEKLKQFRSRIKILSSPTNTGKGHALKLGFAQAHGSVCIIQDADLEYAPKYISSIIKPIVHSQASVVYGSRFAGRVEGMSFFYSFGNRFLTFFTNLLFGSHLTDMETGYKAFSSEAIKKIELTETSFAVEAEITAKLLKRGYEIKEVPIFYRARTKVQGKKIKIFDGVKTLFTLFKIRFI